MAKGKPFGGKQAAPFTKGGGRKTAHPHTAKGTPRQSYASHGAAMVANGKAKA